MTTESPANTMKDAAAPNTATPAKDAQGDVVLRDMSYTVDGRAILSGISLTLTARRIGVIGRNGSGKSTLARMICGLIAPTTGQVHCAGLDVAADRRAAIRAVGILFQNPDHQIIFPTVKEEVVFGLTQLGHAKKDAQRHALRVLDQFGKGDWADRAIHTLSQGQRHLVCLIAVLAMSPAVLVLDEPFAGLDIPTTRQLHTELTKLSQQVILITHDLSLLEHYDELIWLDQGKVLAQGAPADILPRFKSAMDAIGEGLDDDRPDLTG